jgi:hypothetical protein
MDGEAMTDLTLDLRTDRLVDPDPAETECPKCGLIAPVDGSKEGGVDFTDHPMCGRCKFSVLDELAMDDFDRAYARARANGWDD